MPQSVVHDAQESSALSVDTPAAKDAGDAAQHVEKESERTPCIVPDDDANQRLHIPQSVDTNGQTVA